MKETTVTTTEDAWQCEVCGYKHTDEWGGKWAIFHCPRHGEFCNDGLNNCGLYRDVEGKGIQICCPICGWSTIDNWAEGYDNRKGTLPKTEKELKSFYWGQDFVLKDRNNSGMMAYRRLMEY